MRTVCEVDSSIMGSDFKDGVLGLKRFVRMLQDLLDEEGLPIDVRIGITHHNKIASGLRDLTDRIPEWILNEARRLYYEELPG